MNQEKYIKAVLKRLKCSGGKKKEIRKELESDIGAALENGETLEEIIKRMGDASLLAGEFNDNFSQEEIKAHKRKTIWKVMGITAGILLALLLLLFCMVPKSYPIGKSGVFTEEEVIDRAKEAISYFYEDDYASLQAMCKEEEMKNAMNGEKMAEVKAMFGKDWGEFLNYGNVYAAEVSQLGKTTAAVQVSATYENTAATYTVVLDKDMMLIGFFIK